MKEKDKIVEKLQTEIDRIWDSEKYKIRRKDMDRWLKEYNGEWWDKTKLKEHESAVFCNYIFATVETNAPLLTDNRPIWSVRARESHMQEYLNVYSKALEYLWDKLELDWKTYQAVKQSQIWPVGLWKIRFDPDAEFGGEIAIDVDDPRTFFISPKDIDLWNCHYCGTVKQRTLAWVKSNYPKKYEDVEPDDDTQKKIDKDTEDFELQGRDVTIYEIWLKDDSTIEHIEEELDESGKPSGKKTKTTEKKYPNGRYIVFSKNGVRLQDEPSPFSHGKPPWLAFYDYQAPQNFWGIPEPQQIENLNREFNARLQDMVWYCRKHARTNYLLDETSGLDVATVKKQLSEGDNVFTASMVNSENPIKGINPPPFDKTHQDVMSGIGNLIEEVSGVTDISKGMASKKQRQSASEVSILIESSYTRTRQRVRNLEATLKRAAYLMIELMQQYYSEPRTFSSRSDNQIEFMPISNSPAFAGEVSRPEQEPGETPEAYQERIKKDEDYQKIVSMMGDDKIYAAFDIEIQTNSTLPMDKQSLANLALRLAEVQNTPMSIIDSEAVLDILRFPNKDKILERRAKAMQMMGQQSPGAGGQMGAPPSPQGPRPPGVPVGIQMGGQNE